MFLSNLFNPYKGLRKEIYLIFVARMINAFGAFVFPLLTLILTERLGMTTAKAGEVMFMLSILYLPASLLGGKLTDIFGRKVIIITMDAIAIGFYMLCAFVPFGGHTVVFILAAATCMFMADPAHMALVTDYSTAETRESAFSLLYMGWNLGFAFGPMIAGLLYRTHFEWIFIGDALTALIALSLITFGVKERYQKKTDEVEEILTKREASFSGSSFAVILERPILILLPLVMMVFQFSYSQWGFILPMQVNALYGPELYGVIASFNGLVVIIFTPLFTKFLTRYKDMSKMMLGGLTYVIGFGMLGYIHTPLAFFTSVLIFTWGEIILAISFYPLMMNYAPVNHRGRISAIVNNVAGIGHTVGPLIMGRVLLTASMSEGWILTAVVSIGGLVLLALLSVLLKNMGHEETETLTLE